MGDNVKNLFFEALKNASNSYSMNVNGSSTAVPFYVTVPAGRTLVWNRTNLIMVDGGMQAGLFGGIVGGALSNGLNIKVVDENSVTVKDFTTTFGNIKSNDEWNLLAGIDGTIQQSAGNDILPIRWTVSKAGFAPELPSGYRIVFTVSDDLTSLVKFEGMVQGYLK
jgi:hypothetical protein